MNKFRTQTGQFNKRAIMLDAWRRFRDADLMRVFPETTFADCLRDAWHAAKTTDVSPAHAAIRFELDTIEHKTRLTKEDFEKINTLRSQLLHAA